MALLAAFAVPIPAAPTASDAPTAANPPPRIGAVAADRATLGRYERIELTAALSATYDNPYDQRQIALSASFLAPSGAAWKVSGFWDGRREPGSLVATLKRLAGTRCWAARDLRYIYTTAHTAPECFWISCHS